MNWKKMSGVMLIILAILVILVFQVINADAKPKPTHPVHEMTCLVHKGTPIWYVEPATSAHLAHGDPYCDNPGDPPSYDLDYWMPSVQRNDPCAPFEWLCQ